MGWLGRPDRPDLRGFEMLERSSYHLVGLTSVGLRVGDNGVGGKGGDERRARVCAVNEVEVPLEVGWGRTGLRSVDGGRACCDVLLACTTVPLLVLE